MINRSSMERLTGEAFWVGFGVLFSTIGTFVGVRMLTSVMSPEEYGRLALGVSIAMGLQYSIGTALWGTLTRFFSVAKDDGTAVWYWQSIRISLLFSVAAFSILGLLTILIFKFAGFSFSEAWFWFFAVAFGGVQVVGETGSALQNGARNRKIFSLHQNLICWGRFLVAYLIIQYWLPGATGAMLGFVIAALFVMLSQRYWVKKKILEHWSNREKSKDRKKEFFKYLRPLAYSGIFIWIQLFADRWALKSFATLEDVGVYFALYQISFAPALYCSSFLIHLLGPIFFDKAGDGSDPKRLKKTLVLNGKIAGIILLFIAVVVGIAFWIGDQICFVLIDTNYKSGFWAFPWLLATGGIYSVGQQLLMSVYSGLDTRVLIPFRVITSVVAVGCYMIGCMLFGYNGLIGGGLVFSIIFTSLSFRMHHRSTKHFRYSD